MESINEILIKKARQLRADIFEAAISNGGHIASSFSCIDILVAIYYGGVLNINRENSKNNNRDRFILSKGHAETALFAVLADLKYFPKDWFVSHYRSGSCLLGGHPDHRIPGVEITSGALGHGLGIATGISLAARMNNRTHLQIVLMGDAECTEGSVWEAALFASKHKLVNLVTIIDRNRIGSIDFTENFTSLEPLKDKWESFGWECQIIDGHDINKVISALRYCKERNDKKPLCIIANTIKGKGVSFMENDPIWHVKNPSCEKEVERARKELYGE